MNNQLTDSKDFFRENPQLMIWVLAVERFTCTELITYASRTPEHGRLYMEFTKFLREIGTNWCDALKVCQELIDDPDSQDFSFKYAFIGLKMAGKSTASNIVSEILRCQAVDTSDMIYDRLAVELGITLGDLRAMPKEDIRPKLIGIGDRLSKTDPLALIRPVMESKSFTIAGIRKRDQLEALPKDVQVVWINREDHTPDSLDNLDIDPTGHCIVVNNGSCMIEFRYVLSDLLLGITRSLDHPSGVCCVGDSRLRNHKP